MRLYGVYGWNGFTPALTASAKVKYPLWGYFAVAYLPS